MDRYQLQVFALKQEEWEREERKEKKKIQRMDYQLSRVTLQINHPLAPSTAMMIMPPSR